MSYFLTQMILVTKDMERVSLCILYDILIGWAFEQRSAHLQMSTVLLGGLASRGVVQDV